MVREVPPAVRTAPAGLDQGQEGWQLFGLIEWLSGEECRETGGADFMRGLGERLRSLPLPLGCVALYLPTLHPEMRASIMVWSADAPVEVYDRDHTMRHIAAFVGSPVREALETGKWGIVHATTDSAIFSRLEFLRDSDIKELLIAPLLGGRGAVGAVVFGTARASGFTTVDRRAIERFLPALSGMCELRRLRRSEATLLDTYVGRRAGQRILAGHVRRTHTENLNAALLLCDLRDFTAMSNRLPPAQVLDCLNLYFDQVVPTILAGGGEILKFIGDAVLAFFPAGQGPAVSCAAAFGVANTIHARLNSVSAGLEVLRAGIMATSITATSVPACGSISPW